MSGQWRRPRRPQRRGREGAAGLCRTRRGRRYRLDQPWGLSSSRGRHHRRSSSGWTDAGQAASRQAARGDKGRQGGSRWLWRLEPGDSQVGGRRRDCPLGAKPADLEVFSSAAGLGVGLGAESRHGTSFRFLTADGPLASRCPNNVLQPRLRHAPMGPRAAPKPARHTARCFLRAGPAARLSLDSSAHHHSAV